MSERSMTDQDMVDILEAIARDGKNAAAQIAAIKMLKDWDAGEVPQQSEFGQLYEIGKPPLRTKSG